MLLTTSQVAERLQVSTKTVRRLMDSGALTAIRPSARVVRFSVADVERFIAEHTQAAS